MVMRIQTCNDGKIQLCRKNGVLAIQLCDPLAPDTCPCPTWPEAWEEDGNYADPDGFPCGGLDWQYNVNNGFESGFDGAMVYVSNYPDAQWEESRFKDPPVLVTASLSSCKWYIHDSDFPVNFIQTRDYQNTDWTDAGAPDQFFVDLTPGVHWRNRMLSGPFLLLDSIKTIGLTPKGYYESTPLEGVTRATIVTEAAP